MSMSHYVYMLECADGSYYTGYAINVEKRVLEHNGIGDTPTQRSRGARYTRGRRPVRVVYQEECASRSAALRREHAIKRLTRVEKQRLSEGI